MNQFQEWFDTAARGVIAQGAKSLDDERLVCRYRGLNGLKCAIGHIIPDDKYTPEMDRSILFRGVLQKAGLVDFEAHCFEAPECFLRQLQAAHDNVRHEGGPDFVRVYREAMAELAHLHNLSTEALS